MLLFSNIGQVSARPPVPPRPTLQPNPCILKDCHTIRFYVPTSWQSYGLATLNNCFRLYVDDMNYVIGKNTNRWLRYRQIESIIFTDTPPHTGYAYPPLPEYGFEIWVYVRQSTIGRSYGGLASLDVSGAGVVDATYWMQPFDPSTVVWGTGLQDYWTQIHIMLHEIAHMFGAGVGEYYNLCVVNDTTGVAPIQNINCNTLGANDPYWADKPDFFHDPLLRSAVDAGYTTKSSMLSYTRYADLTADFFNNAYRNSYPMVDFDNIVVTVTCNGVPQPLDIVKIWSVEGRLDNPSELIFEDTTNYQGQVTFDWGGINPPHGNVDFLRLIKAYPGASPCGMSAGVAKYVSVFDADIQSMLHDQSVYNIVVELNE